MSPCILTTLPQPGHNRQYTSEHIVKFNNKRNFKRIQRSMPAGERRHVCETWVSRTLEDTPGVDTPLATLYNAYIESHPEAYLDIAQVGKVLKAKYPNRKHRRGKQGSQLYVYRDVAIKKNCYNETTVSTSKIISENIIPLNQSQNGNNLTSGNPSPTIKVNIPGGDNLEVQNLTWAAEFKSKSESLSNNVIIEESIPNDMPVIDFQQNSEVVEKRKRDLSSDNKSARRIKRRKSSNYYYDETYRHQKIFHSKNDENIPVKSTRRRYVETKSIVNPEQVDFLKVLGMQHISTANAPLKRTSHRIRNSPKRSYKTQPSIDDNDSKIVIDNKVTKVETDNLVDSDDMVSSTTDIDKSESESEESVTSSSDDSDNNVGSLCKSPPPLLSLKQEQGSPLLESKEGIALTKLELAAEVKLHETPTVISEFYEQDQGLYNNSDQKSLDYDVVKSRQNRSDIEAFRKSVGRQWIDDHIKQKNGVVTTATEVCIAYNKDHTEAPLTQTNLSMIIRSKFPQRYKLHGTEYVYQDLELVKDGISEEEKRDVNSIPKFTAPPRHRKPKEHLISHDSRIEAKQLTSNNNPSTIKQEFMIEKPASPLYVHMPSTKTLNIKSQPIKSDDLGTQNQFKSTYASSVINYNGMQCIAVLGTPNVSTSNSFLNIDRHMSYPSYVEECALDLTMNKSVKQSSSMSGKTSESKQLQEQQYSNHTIHVKRDLFPNVDNITTNNSGNQKKSDSINYRSYVETDEHNSINNQEFLSDDEEEPELIIDEDYESKHEYNREISSVNISKVDSRISKDMGVDDYIKEEGILNKNIAFDNQPKICMNNSYKANEKLLPESEISYLGTVDKSRMIINHKISSNNNDRFSAKLGLLRDDKTGTSNMMKNNIRKFSDEMKPIKTHSASINNFEHTKKSPFSNSDVLKKVEQVNAINETSHNTEESDGLKNPKISTENYRDNINLSVLRRVLIRALSMTSSNGLELSNEDRAKEMEQSIYPNNSAVSYSIPCVWPSTNTRNPKDFPCKAAAGIHAILLRTTDEQLDQLLLHHQQCPGLGCRDCHPLRAAMVHLTIHRHRCQIWLYLMMIIARHSRECKVTKCSFEFCLFVKHHIHLSGESILSKHSHEEQQLLEVEFRKCRDAGVHGPHLNCNHHSQWTIPKSSEATPVPKTLQLLADALAVNGECESRTDSVIATLQVASSLPINSVR